MFTCSLSLYCTDIFPRIWFIPFNWSLNIFLQLVGNCFSLLDAIPPGSRHHSSPWGWVAPLLLEIAKDVDYVLWWYWWWKDSFRKKQNQIITADADSVSKDFLSVQLKKFPNPSSKIKWNYNLTLFSGHEVRCIMVIENWSKWMLNFPVVYTQYGDFQVWPQK